MRTLSCMGTTPYPHISLCRGARASRASTRAKVLCWFHAFSCQELSTRCLWPSPLSQGDLATSPCVSATSPATLLTKAQLKLGLFDAGKDKQPYFQLGGESIDNAEHQALAHEAAQQ